MKTTCLLLSVSITALACGGDTLDPIVAPNAAPATNAPGTTPPSASDAGPGKDSATPSAVTPPSVFTPNANCVGKETFPGDVVLGCGFGPRVAVLGATSEYVVVMAAPGSSGWKIYRIERANSKIEQIAQSDAGMSATLGEFVFSAEAGTVTYSEGYDISGGFTIGLRELDVAANKRKYLVDYGVYRSLLSTATHAYFAGDNQGPGIWSVPRSGGAPTQVAATSGDPVRTMGGMLYFVKVMSATDARLERIPEAGGTEETIVTNVPATRHHVALDDDGTAFLLDSGLSFGWKVVRVSGATRTDAFECSDPESCTAPEAIVLHGTEVFVKERNSVVGFTKTGAPANGGTRLYLGDGEGRPWFEGDKMIVAEAFGGIDTPSEGIVVARALSPAN